MTPKPWTVAELVTLRRIWADGCVDRDLPQHLPGRSITSARQKAYEMGYPRGPRKALNRKHLAWSPRELELLREACANGVRLERILPQLPGRTLRSARVQAKRQGFEVRKPPKDFETIGSLCQCHRLSRTVLYAVIAYWACRGKLMRWTGAAPQLLYHCVDVGVAVEFWRTTLTRSQYARVAGIELVVLKKILPSNLFPRYLRRYSWRLTPQEWADAVKGAKVSSLFVPEHCIKMSRDASIEEVQQHRRGYDDERKSEGLDRG